MLWSDGALPGTWLSLALRFIRRHRRRSLATGLFILLGTSVLVLIHAIAIGVNDAMVLNTTALHHGEAFVSSEKLEPETVAVTLTQHPAVSAALPRYQLTALGLNGRNSAGLTVYAIDPQLEQTHAAIPRRLVTGHYPREDQRELLLGVESAKSLDIGVGDPVSLLIGSNDSLGKFRVSGLFRTHIAHFDTHVAYLPLKMLPEHGRIRAVGELALFFNTPDERGILDELNTELPRGMSFVSWRNLRPDLVQLIEMNDVSVALVMLFVFILVGLGIGNLFVLTIVERFHEFGILKAMGVTPREVLWLVFLESFILSLLATIGGLLLGWGGAELLSLWGIDFSAMTSSNQYFVMSGLVHPRVTLAGLWQPGILALMMALLSAYIPARVAARRAAARILRFT